MDKASILAEIRRITEANGGKPPGEKGIPGMKPSDWRGRYWEKWSDAQLEAGYSPNKRTEAYPDEYLLESLIILIRDKGEFPTVPRIRLRKRMDSSFPDSMRFAASPASTKLVGQ